MARIIGGRNDTRSNALWGSGSRPGDSRTNALWGKGGRGLVLGLTLMLAMAVPMAATGNDKDSGKNLAKVFIPSDLRAAAAANPDKLFQVIVQAPDNKSVDDLSADVAAVDDGKSSIKKLFKNLGSGSASLTGKQILKLENKGPRGGLLAIMPDVAVRLSDVDDFSNREKYALVTGSPVAWRKAGSLTEPTIAIIDSGIDATRTAEFGNRVLGQIDLTTLTPNSPGDGRGHGTFVASIAAGQAHGRAGIAPEAKLLSIDVMDDTGKANTSDVIAACEWLLVNGAQYNVRVVNMSLHTTAPASVRFDPLDHAVEQLWFKGMVVVAAVGNYNTTPGVASGVPFAPGNDPFIITVGATDIVKSVATLDDFAAPWSAFGYTLDGFAKPDLGAPGRYMAGAVPVGSTLYSERPDKVISTGYMRLSGTSFSAPEVSGAAALLIAQNPSWTPDQVKGALMVAAKPMPFAVPLSAGVGVLDVGKALKVVNPPNPNLALNQFKVAVTGGTGVSFDSASWASIALANASWASASWASASWESASWASASWASASWESASWESASWESASWESASWASASWESTAIADSAPSDGVPADEEVNATDAEILAFNLENGLVDPLPTTTTVVGGL